MDTELGEEWDPVCVGWVGQPADLLRQRLGCLRTHWERALETAKQQEVLVEMRLMCLT